MRDHAEQLPRPESQENFGKFFDRCGDAQVVLLGEAMHGTSELYSARAAIARRLIEQQGFTVVAVEVDWSDAARIEGYVRHHDPQPRHGDRFVRFPTWMGRNHEVLAFAEWLRNDNEHKSEERQVSFHGLVVYSLSESLASVLEYLDSVDPNEAAKALWRCGGLTPWQDHPTEYGKAMVHEGLGDCEEAVPFENSQEAGRQLARKLRERNLDNPVILALPRGGVPVAYEAARRRLIYLGDRQPIDLKDRTVIVVDDGIATGGTVKAALKGVRKNQPRKIILAVPVALRDTL